jgi:rubrerythrin
MEYDEHSLAEFGVGPLILNTKLYIAADYYDIPSLKVTAMQKFEEFADDCARHPASAAYMAEFPEVIELIYANISQEVASPSFQELAVGVLVRYADVFFTSDNELSSELSNVMKHCDLFERDVGLAMFRKWRDFRKWKCKKCGHIWAEPEPSDPNRICPECLEKRQ